MDEKNLKKSKKGFITMALAIFIASIFAVVGFTVVLEETNKTEFCVSCHSMENNYKELKESAHWNNASGVHAECSDCHVPKEFIPKMKAKILAAKDIWHEIIGTIDTPEKFEAHRWDMANRVWDKMKANDSRECRSCHSFERMDPDEQDKFAARKHLRAKKQGKTCIDCHKGIAHEEPDEPEEDETEEEKA